MSEIGPTTPPGSRRDDTMTYFLFGFKSGLWICREDIIDYRQKEETKGRGHRSRTGAWGWDVFVNLIQSLVDVVVLMPLGVVSSLWKDHTHMLSTSRQQPDARLVSYLTNLQSERWNGRTDAVLRHRWPERYLTPVISMNHFHLLHVTWLLQTHLAVPVRLFLKGRISQVSGVLFGFLDVLTLAHRIVLVIDHELVEESEQKGSTFHTGVIQAAEGSSETCCRTEVCEAVRIASLQWTGGRGLFSDSSGWWFR